MLIYHFCKVLLFTSHSWLTKSMKIVPFIIINHIVLSTVHRLQAPENDMLQSLPRPVSHPSPEFYLWTCHGVYDKALIFLLHVYMYVYTPTHMLTSLLTSDNRTTRKPSRQEPASGMIAPSCPWPSWSHIPHCLLVSAHTADLPDSSPFLPAECQSGGWLIGWVAAFGMAFKRLHCGPLVCLLHGCNWV